MSYGLDAQLISQSAANSNVLINNGMEIWQRGTGFSNPADSTYTADKWIVSRSGSWTFTVSREPIIVDRGTYSMKISVTVGGTTLNVGQTLENGAAYAGQYMTFSVRINTSTANFARLRVADGSNVFFSNYHSGSGNWETLTYTVKVISAVSVAVDIAPLVGIAYVDSAMFVPGTQPVPYTPMTPADDIARCMRYYETSPSGIVLLLMQHDSTSGLRVRSRFASRFRAVKSAVPTITFSVFGVNLTNDPTSATTTELSDTGNWTISPAATTDGFFSTLSRTTDQTARDVIEFSHSWAAEVA